MRVGRSVCFIFLMVVVMTLIPEASFAQRSVSPRIDTITRPIQVPRSITPPVVIRPRADVDRTVIYQDQRGDLKAITVPPPPPELRHTLHGHAHCAGHCRVICAGDMNCRLACERSCDLEFSDEKED